MKTVLNTATDTDLAEALGVRQNTVSTWRTRGSLDFPLIISKCDNADLNWLLTGNGPMLRDGRPAPEQIASTESPDAGREAIIYKGLLAEQRAEHKREIAARDEEIKKLNRQLGAAEAKLGEREARGFRTEDLGGVRPADFPYTTSGKNLYRK